jgi:hypothetical protein
MGSQGVSSWPDENYYKELDRLFGLMRLQFQNNLDSIHLLLYIHNMKTKTMKISILFDSEDNENVFVSSTIHNLRGLVRNHLIKNGWFYSNFYDDGNISLTGKEYLDKNLYKSDFRIDTFEIDIAGECSKLKG